MKKHERILANIVKELQVENKKRLVDFTLLISFDRDAAFRSLGFAEGVEYAMYLIREQTASRETNKDTKL